MSRETITEIIYWNKDEWDKKPVEELEDYRRKLKDSAEGCLQAANDDSSCGYYDEAREERDAANMIFKESKAIKRYLKSRH